RGEALMPMERAPVSNPTPLPAPAPAAQVLPEPVPEPQPPIETATVASATAKKTSGANLPAAQSAPKPRPSGSNLPRVQPKSGLTAAISKKRSSTTMPAVSATKFSTGRKRLPGRSRPMSPGRGLTSEEEPAEPAAAKKPNDWSEFDRQVLIPGGF